jgi:hypothetical protein
LCKHHCQCTSLHTHVALWQCSTRLTQVAVHINKTLQHARTQMHLPCSLVAAHKTSADNSISFHSTPINHLVSFQTILARYNYKHGQIPHLHSQGFAHHFRPLFDTLLFSPVSLFHSRMFPEASEGVSSCVYHIFPSLSL